MITIKKGLVVLIVAFISLGGALAFDNWDDLNFYNAQGWGKLDYMMMTSGMNLNLVISEDNVWKTLETDLFATGAEKAQLYSVSKFSSVDGGDIYTSQNSINQLYYIPSGYSLIMSQDIASNGVNGAATMSSQASLVDPNTNENIATFSSNSDQYDVDTLINNGLIDMGFTMDIDQLRAIQGSTTYSTDNTESHGPFTISYGQTKNLPVDMAQT
jgi:hypothetical protein